MVQESKPVIHRLRLATCAYDGEEAADQMENGHFDLLLLCAIYLVVFKGSY